MICNVCGARMLKTGVSKDPDTRATITEYACIVCGNHDSRIEWDVV